MIQQSMNLDPLQKYVDAYHIARGGEKTKAYKKLVRKRADQLKAELRAKARMERKAA
jgi:hypothetical protein